MKRTIIIYFVTFASVISSKKIRQDVLESFQVIILPFMDECISKSNVDKEFADRWFKYAELQDEPKMKCFIRCIYEKIGWFRADATPIITVMEEEIAKIPGGDVQIIEACRKKAAVGEDSCDSLYKFDECIIDKFSV